MNGVVGGVQWGYNWQLGNWVIGPELDFQSVRAARRRPTYCVNVGCTTTTNSRAQAALVRHSAHPHRLPAVSSTSCSTPPVAWHTARSSRTTRCSRPASALRQVELRRHPRRLHHRRRHGGSLGGGSSTKTSSTCGSTWARPPRPPRSAACVVDTYRQPGDRQHRSHRSELQIGRRQD